MHPIVRVAIGILLCVTLYWIPTGIAVFRQHPQLGPIAVVDTFLGWTIIGYIIPLAWSMSSISKTRVA